MRTSFGYTLSIIILKSVSGRFSIINDNALQDMNEFLLNIYRKYTTVEHKRYF